MTDAHARFMRTALGLASRNLGHTWPNPAVGALVVKDGQIIAGGYTARGGRPHAETQALNDAGKDAKGATLYVTFEPCAHHGKTPPCTEAIIKSGIRHVVIACGDPAPHVNGKGIAQLEAAGISITNHVLEQEALELNRGFISTMQKKRPFVALKIATSADGKIAEKPGVQTWITGEAARNYGHLLRSQYDAVITGIGTVLTDDPMMNCRLPGLEKSSPVRVVLDRSHRLPPESKIATTKDDYTTWVLTTKTIPETLAHLAEKGITRVLVEAGQGLNTAFLESGLVDRVYWFKSPTLLGKTGLDAVKGGLSALARWKTLEHTALPPDHMDILEPCLPAS